MPTNRRCGLVFEKSKTLPLHFARLQSAVREKPRPMEGQRGERHGPARLLPPRPAVQNLPSPKKVAFTQPDASPVRGNISPESPLRTAGRHSSKLLNHSLEGWHPSAFHLPTGFYATNRHHMPISLSPDTYLAAATYPCQLRSMPMSSWPHAHVTLATCLCHHLRHAYVAEVRCLCRQSDIGISPALHQKRPVYRCSGRPFFVLFGHFRLEMRIFPASEGVFRGGQ